MLNQVSFSIFAFIEKHISYTFSIVVFSLTGAYFSAAYAYFFGSVLIPNFSIENNSIEIAVFLVALAIATIGHTLHYGAAGQLGLDGLDQKIRLINRTLKENPNLHHAKTKQLELLLNELAELPQHNMLTAVSHAVLIIILVGVASFVNKGNLEQFWIILAGWFIAATVYGGFTYVITDFFSASKRVEIKEILISRNQNIHTRQGLISLKAKFLFIPFLSTLSISIMALFTSMGEKPLWQIIVFICITLFAISLLSFMYFNSLNSTLKQIGKAASDLAAGGQGALPLSAIEKEFVDFSANFEKAGAEVNDIRRNLESRVEERTFELNQTLDRINTLKEQQDGDYYLTHLLTQPLTGVDDKNPVVDVQILVKQKKTFTFRNREWEIGGDLCNSAQIQLGGRNFRFFLNGDAMGKSIQGAGGAIVLGVVFKSIVHRRRQRDSNTSSPELFLQDCFHELQNTYLTFDGSMLMSLVMGLVDEDTGMFYYVNLEQPYIILYRNSRAEFLENELHLHKLGVPGIEENFSIRTFKLLPGDVLIMGSDGRDDLLLGYDKENERVINHDETLFLNHVDVGHGDLELIPEALGETGELTDDLSLMRIGFREDAPLSAPEELDLAGLSGNGKNQQTYEELKELYLSHPEHPELTELLADLALNLKDFESAALYSEHCTLIKPDASIHLLTTSEALRKFMPLTRGKLHRAIEFSERLKLREPGNLPNLKHLVSLYNLKQDRQSAQMLEEKIAKLSHSLSVTG